MDQFGSVQVENSRMTDLFRNKLIVTGILGLSIGILLGLIYGYKIDPVEWVNVSLDLTRADIQEDYLRMAIDAYKLYMDPTKAIQRYQELGEAGDFTLKKVEASPGVQGEEAVRNYRNLVTISISDSVHPLSNCPAVEPQNNKLCLFLWLGTIVLVGGLSVYFFNRTRPREAKLPSPSVSEPKELSQEHEEEQDFSWIEATPPLTKFMCSYGISDDLFDLSYSIDTREGAFLGECGVEIVKTLDDSTPKKVTAFDVWLFDKNEINTKSIVMMSNHAYADDILRTQMGVKGRPALAKIGKEIPLRTTHLLMKIRVVDLVGEAGSAQHCDYFLRLILELKVWYTG
jgi:hypothetical protein